MKLIKAALAAFALAFTGTTVAAPIAAAQGTNVVVIDQSRIMQESAGGKDIISKVNAIEQTMQSELKPTQDSLATEGQALDAKTANMTMDAIAADDALRTEVEQFAQKAQAFNRRRKIASAELQATERAAWNQFFSAMQPVLQEVVAEKGADVILDRSDAIYASPSVDATDLVISKMDAKLSTVNVVRQKIQTQQPQQ
ncbi:OmpH family outer membrane protein [Henriciella aquimarina]|uniref:OmpH family outer membrane protein n=1 Tax=Henriciella aquimarina TaxID=545261 RepID=UPI0009FC59BA|nr:OmpH family outer membrane protein [Henriciella aquimarina]